MQPDKAYKFSHFRVRYPGSATAEARGGATVAYTVVDDTLYCAAAYCSPRDNFVYKTGRIKSLARLMNFVQHPEKKDDNIYFTTPIKDDDISAAVKRVQAFMVEGLGYSTRYEQAAA